MRANGQKKLSPYQRTQTDQKTPLQKPRTQKDTESEQTTRLDNKTQAQTGFEHNRAI